MEPVENQDVHTEHCCKTHGCKYGYIDCPVESGQKQQSFPCEQCEWDDYEFPIFMDRYKDKVRAAFEDILVNQIVEWLDEELATAITDSQARVTTRYIRDRILSRTFRK